MRYHDFNAEKPPIDELCLFVFRKAQIKGRCLISEVRFKFGIYNGDKTHDEQHFLIDTDEFSQWIRAIELDNILINMG